MNEAEVQSFLGQFKNAEERMKAWPQWMQDAAYEAAATFPKSTAIHHPGTSCRAKNQYGQCNCPQGECSLGNAGTREDGNG